MNASLSLKHSHPAELCIPVHPSLQGQRLPPAQEGGIQPHRHRVVLRTSKDLCSLWQGAASGLPAALWIYSLPSKSRSVPTAVTGCCSKVKGSPSVPHITQGLCRVFSFSEQLPCHPRYLYIPQALTVMGVRMSTSSQAIPTPNYSAVCCSGSLTRLQHTMEKFQEVQVCHFGLWVSFNASLCRGRATTKALSWQAFLTALGPWLSWAHSKELLSFACHHTTITYLTHPWQPTRFPFTNSCVE